MIEVNKIYNEPCEKTLERLPGQFIDLTVTSPPYDDLREYKGFSFDLNLIISELYRATKNGGVCVWIIGDQVINGSETGTSMLHAVRFMKMGWNLHDTMIYEKNGAAFPANDKSTRYTQIFEFMFVTKKMHGL